MKFAILTIFASLSVALSCDCGFWDGAKCATKIVSCVSSCKGGVSSNCMSCLKRLGTGCCKCVGKAVGEVSDKYGNEICDHCGLLGSAEAAPAKPAPAATCQSSAENACANSPPKQKAACLVQLSRELASEALKLGFQVPLRKHTVVTSSGEAVHFSQHELGCSWYDLGCKFNSGKCTICKKAVPLLAKTGSKGLCTAGCAVAVEGVGGGPEDPVADAVALACPIICGQIFSAGGRAAAGPVCSAAHMC